MNLKDEQRQMREREKPLRKATDWYSVSDIATHWGYSRGKVARMLEPYRGSVGFMDSGSSEDVRGHVRRYAVITISPALLARIESDLQGTPPKQADKKKRVL
jgi:hypothetical protein